MFKINILLGIIFIYTKCTTSQITLTQNSINILRNSALNAHNGYRLTCQAQNLALDDTLNQQAQSWAEQLAATKSFSHSSNGPENLFMSGTSSVQNVDQTANDMGIASTNSWFSEISNWNFDTSKSKGTGETGHFTQVVWADAVKAGFGIAYYSSNGFNNFIIVARYDKGNMGGQFGSNVKRCSISGTTKSSSTTTAYSSTTTTKSTTTSTSSTSTTTTSPTTTKTIPSTSTTTTKNSTLTTTISSTPIPTVITSTTSSAIPRTTTYSTTTTRPTQRTTWRSKITKNRWP